jgi:hypothetical protein
MGFKVLRMARPQAVQGLVGPQEALQRLEMCLAMTTDINITGAAMDKRERHELVFFPIRLKYTQPGLDRSSAHRPCGLS